MNPELFQKLSDIFLQTNEVWEASQLAYAANDMEEFRRLKAEHKKLAALYRLTRQSDSATIH